MPITAMTRRASASNAATKASEASTSATKAEASEAAAASSETAAAASTTTAGNHATAAGVSETNAKASETASAASELAAATSESKALASELAAAASEDNAAASASSAAGSATSASTSATVAQTARSGAEAARDATQALLDQFGDRYLGDAVSDPTTDLDGSALEKGDVYFNTTDNVLKFYSGTQWVAPENVATTAANEAQASAAAAASSEQAAAGYASTATTESTAAEAAKLAAQTAASNAETSEDNAAASASSASGSASTATTAANTATTKASQASSSATAAANSATAAQASADSASASEAAIATTIATALDAHVAAADPHGQYLLETTATNLLAGKVDTTDSRLTNAREWTASTVTQAEAEAGSATTRRAWTALRVFNAIASWWNKSAAKTKLDGIATGATKNATDAQLRSRSTHTGEQAISTVTGLQTALNGKAAASHTHTMAQISGTLPYAQLPTIRHGDTNFANQALNTNSSVQHAKVRTGGTVDDGTNSLQVSGGTRTDTLAAGNVQSPQESIDTDGNVQVRGEGQVKMGDFAMQYNAATKSLDFNWIGG